ncbi:MAG: hypothetical protein OEW06_15495 [Gemmatimonadota bacterium]|nr:hypothetical protein [Gemmatimonadota bacterium]MDH4350537.1 hypothetical protein [Gemmatimonadota bacterium]
MGFDTQPNAWQCGPFALKHALLALGIVADEGVLTRVSGATEAGADERDLARAAERYGCTLAGERVDSAVDARQRLAVHLRAPTPVLLCVDQWSHWVTAAGMEGDTVVLLDSRERSVFQTVGWSVLQHRLAYRSRRARVSYDLHPVIPKRPVPRARFSIPRVDFLLSDEQRDLVRTWSAYLAALLPVSAMPSAQTAWTVAIGDRLREHAATLLGGLPTRHALRSHRSLSHAAFVADTHALEAAVDAAGDVAAVARQIAERAVAA